MEDYSTTVIKQVKETVEGNIQKTIQKYLQHLMMIFLIELLDEHSSNKKIENLQKIISCILKKLIYLKTYL